MHELVIEHKDKLALSQTLIVAKWTGGMCIPESVAKSSAKLLLFLSWYFSPFVRVFLHEQTCGHAINVSNLNATPPKLTAKTISKKVMKSAFFQPNSLTRAPIVAMQGM